MARTRKDILESIAANTAAKREGRGWSQARLAEEADVATRTVQDLEAARYNPTIMTLLALADALGSDVDSLLRPAKRPRRKPGRPKH